MLQEMYDCAYKTYRIKLPQEIEDTINSIRRNFSNLPEEQELQGNAIFNLSNKSLIAQNENKRFNIFGRNKVKQIQEETQIIENQEREFVNVKYKPQIETIMLEISAKVNRIHQKFMNNDYFYRDKENQLEERR